MTQNLIITNNRDSEYVEFNVNIPDGYNKFRLEYLNGSIINQNYLKVGDTITFKFANNPIRYDIPKGAVNLIYNDKSTVADPTPYEYLELDVFKYQKLVYIPIYQCWSTKYNRIIYIINLCDRNYLKEQPTSQQSDVLIDSTDGVDTYVSFTGNYCLAFDSTPIDKIPDQTITIGESISNSKTRPVDMGSYQLSNNVVNEVSVNTVTTNTYNYGSVWRYTVSNQVLKHTETITPDIGAVISTMQLVLGVLNTDENKTYAASEWTLLPSDILSTDSDKNTSRYKVYKLDVSLPIDLLEEINDGYKPSIRYSNNIDWSRAPYIVLKDSDGKYSNIPPGWSMKGEEFEGSDLIGIAEDGSEILFDPDLTTGYINTDWWYTGREITYKVQYLDEGTMQWKDITNMSFDLGDDHLTTFTIARRSDVRYRSSRGTDHYIRILTPGSQTNRRKLYLCGRLGIGGTTITYQLNSGVTRFVNLYNISQPITNVTTDLMQLTDTAHPLLNTEDLYVTAVEDSDHRPGIKLSTKPLRNINHVVHVNVNASPDTSDAHPYTYSVTNNVIQWDDDTEQETIGDAPLQVFIPLKSNIFIEQLTDYTERQGWFIIDSINGSPATYLSDNVCRVYLATGHDTLNVEQPTEDDKKFKTFNGTLIFDRSNTKITRLFSNDLTGACLGYLNDILAAKLSRYYFCCNYNVWNSFLDTQQQSINFTMDLSFLANLYNNSQFFTGYHETWMSNTSDLVKLIGSENVVNNCMSSLYPEEQQYDCLLTYNKAYDTSGGTPYPPLDSKPKSTLRYKLFHFYTSGLTDYPYAGVGDWDNVSAIVGGGLNLMYVPTDKPYDNKLLNNTIGQLNNDCYNRICEKPIYVYDIPTARNNQEHIYANVIDTLPTYNNGDVGGGGYIESLPVFRIYRNSNFEQTDLTITTGGIKLLHPIYLQSTPRMLVNNILYMLDTIIEYLLKQYNNITNADNSFGYLGVLIPINDPLDPTRTLSSYPNEHPLLRFSSIRTPNNNGNYIAASLDSMMLLNYMHTTSINEYQSIKELTDSLPTAASNEEVIADLTTNSIETNVQLFSYKYFNFLSEVNQFAMVVFNSMYVETVPFNTDILSLYWDLTKVSDGKVVVDSDLIAKLTNTIQGYINNSMSFNNIKTCKVFICKLGEFLDFPRILYAGCNSYNNTVNVTVWNYDSTKYKSPIATNYVTTPDSDVTKLYTSTVDRPEQKVNTTLFGVMFRYHQLSHGYQNFPNELTNEYLVSKSLGNRTFTLVLYDEYGRRIPNEDTNQGFKNNLYIELVLE